MLKITRIKDGGVVFSLSGRIEAENIGELATLLSGKGDDHRIVLDLKDLTLVDQDGISFLKCFEAEGIELRNCPAYIREWMNGERQ